MLRWSHISHVLGVLLFCGFFSAPVCLWMLAGSPPKSCMSSLLWAPKEALEGTPAPTPVDCTGLPADAGGCDRGDGVGVVLLSPA